MKKLYYFALALLLPLLGNAQKTLPYATGFETVQEQSEWTEFRVGPAKDPLYKWNFGSNQLNHSYPVGGSQLTNDWMVSPELSYTSGAIIDSIMFKAGGFGMPMGEDTIALYVLEGSNDPEQATSMTLLKLFTDSTYANDNTWRTFYNIPVSVNASNSFYLGIRYQTTSNWLDVSIDNISVSSTVGGVEIENTLNQVQVYPNPTSQYLNLDFDQNILIDQINIWDLNGREVKRYTANERSLNIEGLNTGVYVLQLVMKDQTQTIPFEVK